MIEMKNVTKIIKKKMVLDNISYCFEEGKIYGLCGPNGSGKTMILRMLAGLILPTKGEVVVDGKILHKDISFPPETGIIIEHMELLPHLNAFDNLKLLGKINNTATDEDIKISLERVDLTSMLPVKKFSLGMKQRLNIAQAIFERQRLILLDEPTNALDEKGVSHIHKVLSEERERGACIVMATHHKEDMSELCDTILNVVDGSIEAVE